MKRGWGSVTRVLEGSERLHRNLKVWDTEKKQVLGLERLVGGDVEMEMSFEAADS